MNRWPGTLTLLVGGVLLTIAWLGTPVHLPLYDGIRLPAQPYRYLQPPSGYKNPGPPAVARHTFHVSHGSWTYQSLSTPERPAQISVLLDDNAVILPPGTHDVTVTIHAVPPPQDPDDGTISGNVYHINAYTDTGQPVRLRAGKTTVNLRATRSHGSPIIERYAGSSHWVHLETGQYIGIALYGATTNQLGDFALVYPGPVHHGSPLDPYLPYIIIGALVLAMAGLVPIVMYLVRRQTSPN